MASPIAAQLNHGNQSGDDVRPSCQHAPSNGGACVRIVLLCHVATGSRSEPVGAKGIVQTTECSDSKYRQALRTAAHDLESGDMDATANRCYYAI